ncbi:MAG: dipicolinate synthase subunit B [Erysipelotrichaceae bacterium]|nr:dipicolinate synthase subunit B [Erysipelotrichaceae bacterium]MCI9523488.1 dipicolinate synthase subunit B [Erysipelotrichaceae bacterium]
MENKHILIGISGSFCNHENVLKQFQALSKKNKLTFVVSESVYYTTTRFFERNAFITKLEEISATPIIHTLVEAEKIGPMNPYDLMLVAPCTATQCAKFVHGIYDSPLTLAMKAMIRNQKNIVIGFSSNDALGISGENLFRLFSMKHLYVMPIAQDAPDKKPLSVVAVWETMEETLDKAFENKQIQPILRERHL